MTNSPAPSNNISPNEKDWYVIACKIRTQNNKLKQQISGLENIVEEQEQQIEIEARKNQNFDELLAEQEEIRLALEEEINEYKEQILQQEQQIETQQENINQLSQELAKIQQQTARLERECSLLQESYNDNENKLKQIETENNDLRIRLQRQQRYNLQYKTALDQFLDSSTISNRNSDSNGLGIKSWADNDLDSEDDNSSSKDFDLSIGENNDFLKVPPTINSSIESNKNDSTPPNKDDLSQTLSTNENDHSDNEDHKSQIEEQKNNHKLFIKLPQFGMKKKEQE